MGRAKKSVEVEAQVIARGNVVPMMTETESEETVQYVSDEDAAREDTEIPVTRSRNAQKMIYHKPVGRTRKKRPALQKIGVIGSSFVP